MGTSDYKMPKIPNTIGNRNRLKILIKLEQLWICPCIGTVKSNVNRNISNNFYTIFICIRL